MRLYKTLFCAAVAMPVLLSPTLADEMQMKPGMMMMIDHDGKVMTMQMDDSKMSKEEMRDMMNKGTAMKHPMMSMAETNCARWRRDSVPAGLREKGYEGSLSRR